ncbi:1-deoxy-D-xylulose-5-phosphate reductoisomerase [Candidatus Vallotia tarda]|uniref:1-deoxy-D-xylulose 5-phosphate reductoisomerase n=1 Tax=Candidatus Vallotiella hemipterorum TaxID=1177213 RepID=A0A916JTJ3_9BURK|nr:1-deoxy-D-xylulose-5-phosphate reductoisomerase [Candidatus Vallotia tarda]CAG7602177.1 1-deoxy-D-xylulose 5-phosphate reductoisomerase [Candidatus Vallotia tarda]
MQHYVTLLGSTGSIGDSTLNVIARYPDRFSIHALTAHRNWEKLAQQCMQFTPYVAVVDDAQTATHLQERLYAAGCVTRVDYGRAAMVSAAVDNACNIVVAAIVGAAGLEPTLAAAHAGKRILLANKEALVMSGALFMDAVHASGASLLPIDSEHNAIFQCFPREPNVHGEVTRIQLTASGGPFRLREPITLVNVTPEEACKHPNWIMGRKISVDSATMMNKGLEVIEASWLFNLRPEQIHILIHPQSVIHSLVSYADGSTLAQLGNPDMRTPIAHALAFPTRIVSGVEQLDLAKVATLTFEPLDYKRFPCLSLALQALHEGGAASTVLNAANEVAVEAFLARHIGFTAIAAVVSDVLEQVQANVSTTLDAVLDIDAQARRAAQEALSRYLYS